MDPERSSQAAPDSRRAELATPESTLRTDLHASLQRYVRWGKRLDRIETAVAMLDAVREAWAKKLDQMRSASDERN